MCKDFIIVVVKRLILDKIQSFYIENVFWDCLSHDGFNYNKEVYWSTTTFSSGMALFAS